MPEYRRQELKVGDRVQIIEGFPVGNKKLYNVKGTVRQCLTGFDVGVEWDEDIGGHNLDSGMPEKLNNNRGWYVNPLDLIKLDKQLELAFD